MFFIHKNFTKRNYDCTNVVVCEADKAPNEFWLPATEDAIKPSMSMLWIENGVKYFGWM